MADGDIGRGKWGFAWPVFWAALYAVAVGTWPGGYDALRFFFRPPRDDLIAPGWVHLFTAPLGLLPWPLSWQLLVFLTVLGIAALRRAFYGRAEKWWELPVILFSAPVVWNMWLGQVEVLTVVGALLGVLFYRGRLSHRWLGLAWLFLLSKPQAGLGMALFFAGVLYLRRRSWRVFLFPGGLFVALVLASVLLWPAWVGNWMGMMSVFHPTWWNASVWPWGLLAVPVLWFTRRWEWRPRFRLLAAVTLLGSPYFALYHCTTLDTLFERPVEMFLISWAIVAAGMLTGQGWMRFGWVLPLYVLMMELVRRKGDR